MDRLFNLDNMSNSIQFMDLKTLPKLLGISKNSRNTFKQFWHEFFKLHIQSKSAAIFEFILLSKLIESKLEREEIFAKILNFDPENDSNPSLTKLCESKLGEDYYLNYLI